jgi:rRNA maturation RNase YbeY
MRTTRHAGAMRGERKRPERRPGSNAHNRFDLSIHPRTTPYLPFLRRHLRAARRLIDAPLQHLNVILVGDRQMSDLHHQFMHVKGPTDVMTFPIELDPAGRPLSGEVYVCLPYARREARRRNLPVSHELLLYALHGMLHLAGFDDRTPRRFAQMHEREDQLLTDIGIGPVFATAKPGAGANRPLAASHRPKTGGTRP